MKLTREKFTLLVEERLDNLVDYVHGGLEQIIRQQLRDWDARYSRHTFSAYVGHGMLVLEMDPPVAGVTNPNYLDDRFPISWEAKKLIDYFNGFDGVNIGMGDTPSFGP